MLLSRFQWSMTSYSYRNIKLGKFGTIYKWNSILLQRCRNTTVYINNHCKYFVLNSVHHNDRIRFCRVALAFKAVQVWSVDCRNVFTPHWQFVEWYDEILIQTTTLSSFYLFSWFSQTLNNTARHLPDVFNQIHEQQGNSDTMSCSTIHNMYWIKAVYSTRPFCLFSSIINGALETLEHVL